MCAQFATLYIVLANSGICTRNISWVCSVNSKYYYLALQSTIYCCTHIAQASGGICTCSSYFVCSLVDAAVYTAHYVQLTIQSAQFAVHNFKSKLWSAKLFLILHYFESCSLNANSICSGNWNAKTLQHWLKIHHLEDALTAAAEYSSSHCVKLLLGVEKDENEWQKR